MPPLGNAPQGVTSNDSEGRKLQMASRKAEIVRAPKNLRGVAMLYVGALTFLGVMLSAGPASAGIITLGQNANDNLCFGNGGHIAIEVSISNGNNSGCGQALSGGTHEISGPLSGSGTGTYH